MGTKDYYMKKIVKYEKHPEMIKLKKIPLSMIENKDTLKNINKFTNPSINKLCDHVQFKYAKSFSQGVCYECFISHIKLSGGIYGGRNPPSYINVLKKRNVKKQKIYNKVMYFKVSSKQQPNGYSQYSKEKFNYISSKDPMGEKNIKIVTKTLTKNHNQNSKSNSITPISKITNRRVKNCNINIGNFNYPIEKHSSLSDNKTTLIHSFNQYKQTNKIDLDRTSKILSLTKPQLILVVDYSVLLVKIAPFFISKDDIIFKNTDI